MTGLSISPQQKLCAADGRSDRGDGGGAVIVVVMMVIVVMVVVQ